MIPLEPVEQIFTELPYFRRDLLHLPLGNFTNAVVIGDISLGTAIVQVVGANLSLRPHDLRQRMECRPMMSGPEGAKTGGLKGSSGQLQSCVVCRSEAAVGGKLWNFSVGQVAVHHTQKVSHFLGGSSVRADAPVSQQVL
jgi:hypothetical protein